MPPHVKFSREEIVEAALRVTRAGGIVSLTARSLAAELGASTRPMFTYFDTMDALKDEVYEAAREVYKAYVEQGLSEPIPFLGVGQSYIRFAREEPELYKLLFLQKPEGARGGVMDALRFSQDLVRESLMRIYHMDELHADCYFRDLWLVAFSFATMVVTDDSPLSEGQMSAIMSEMSLAICKAYKEVPGLVEGTYDKDAVFKELVGE